MLAEPKALKAVVEEFVELGVMLVITAFPSFLRTTLNVSVRSAVSFGAAV